MKDKHLISAAIDVGTTTVSAVVLDVTDKRQLNSYNRPNDSTLVHNTSAHEQDPARILEIAGELAELMFECYPDISCLGFTGQMHGILYVDPDGNAVSPLFTWQDGRGNLVSDSGRSYCDEIAELTGYTVSSGYGLVTHYCNTRRGEYTAPGLKICSIMDYLAMRFTGSKTPLVHPSNAASFGFFDVRKGEFDRAALLKAGIDENVLPAIVSDDSPIGSYRGIPVSAAIGDNQASVFGSVADEGDSVLVNYGTGSQMSLISDKTEVSAPLEVRPYLFGKNLVCGCALCGGSSYAILEGFFRSYAVSCGMVDESQYKTMDVLAEAAYDGKKAPLEVKTLFKGRRSDPDLRASIVGIGEDNFTPEQMILGTIHGMADELCEMYLSCGERRRLLVASGNAVQKGRVLRSVLSDKFGMPLFVPASKEEAATGAAMYAAICSGAADLTAVKTCIKYF